jgi:hypothetical protein
MDPQPNPRWWKVPASKPDEVLNAVRHSLNTQNSWRTTTLSERYRIIWGYERDRWFQRWGTAGRALAHAPSSIQRDYAWLESATSVPSPNIVRSSTDSVVSATLAETPPVAVQASGATFEDQWSIEEFESALNALFNTPESEAAERKIARDGILTGWAHAMCTNDRGRLIVERLLPWQVAIDPYDARDGRPLSCSVSKFEDRAGLLAWLDAFEGVQPRMGTIREQIEKMDAVPARSSSDGDQTNWTTYDWELTLAGTREDADRLLATHSWRAASADGREDGRYVLTVGSGDEGSAILVLDMPFKRARIPVETFAPMPMDEGIWGAGLGHLIVPWQEALDRAFFKVQRALDKYGHIRIVVPAGSVSGATKAAMSTQGVTIIETDTSLPNGVPQIYDPQVVRKEDLEHIERILNLSQTTYGINAMMSRGASQLGANASGQALQEEHYRSLDRWSDVVKNWQEFRLRLAEQMLWLVDDVLQTNKKFAASYEYLGRPIRRSWSDLTKLRQDKNIALELRGEAALGRGGRTARIQEWASQGLLDPAIAKEALLSTPDLRKAARDALAPIRLVEWQLRMIVENDNRWDAQPDADTPRDLAIQRVTSMIQRARVEGAKAETVERLRDYRYAAQALPTAQVALPPMAGAPAAPGAASPGPPPAAVLP